MIAKLECRAEAATAAVRLAAIQGRRSLSGRVVVYSTTLGTPEFDTLRCAQLEARQRTGRGILSGWCITRRYTTAEWSVASNVLVSRFRTFEPAGEECGTQYDDSAACPECSAGGEQVSPLRLPASRLPRGVDIAATIAGELVVSERFRTCAIEAGLTGARFDPIKSPRAPHKPVEAWFQLRTNSPLLEVAPESKFGEDPFDDSGYGRCSRGDLAGLNLLSELFIRPPSAPGADFFETRQRVGLANGVGLLRARRLLVLSARARTVLLAAKMRSLQLEVAHIRP